MTNTEQTIKPEAQKHIIQYLESCDPLIMMSILMELGRSKRFILTDDEYRQISGCHNLLAAIFRNE